MKDINKLIEIASNLAIAEYNKQKESYNALGLLPIFEKWLDRLIKLSSNQNKT